MKALFTRLFLTNWPRKLVAFLAAIIIWILVNQSITMTTTLPDVSVRIQNLPADKTVVGLLPNGTLKKKISITVQGSKSIIEDLSASDIEIVVNADGRKESWLAHIDKKNLVFLQDDQILKKQIKEVVTNDLFIKVSKLVTEEIPITICPPLGDPPSGYQFLDIWPKELLQKVSGPQEEIEALKEKGLELSFNLNEVTKKELDSLYELQASTSAEEISFFVPASWKQVAIPFLNNSLEALNDPRAELLRIDFLKKELLPIGTKLPLTLFFPLKYSATLNPETYSLATGSIVEKKNGVPILTVPLFVRDVSRLFLEVVKDNVAITLIAAPKNVQNVLDWSVTFINPKALEDSYVAVALKTSYKKYEGEILRKNTEFYLRNRFQTYMNHFILYTLEDKKLRLIPLLQSNEITLDLEKGKS